MAKQTKEPQAVVKSLTFWYEEDKWQNHLAYIKKNISSELKERVAATLQSVLAQEPEQKTSLELHRLGLLLLEANLDIIMKTDALYDNIVPKKNAKNNKSKAEKGEAKTGKKTKEEKEKTKKARKATKKRLDNELGRFEGKRMQDALDKALSNYQQASREEKLTGLPAAEQGEQFLTLFKILLNDQSRKNKAETDKWEGNVNKKKFISYSLDQLIKQKYLTYLGKKPSLDEMINKTKVRKYLEQRFAEIVQRPDAKKTKVLLQALEKTIRQNQDKPEVIEKEINRILKEEFKTFLEDKPGKEILTDAKKVIPKMQAKLATLPPIPAEEVIQKEIEGILMLIDTVSFKHDKSESYGEEIDYNLSLDEEESLALANAFINKTLKFYAWASGRYRPELIMWLSNHPHKKVEKDYVNSRMSNIKLNYLRDYLTYRLVLNKCDSSFLNKLWEAQLPEAYQEFKLKDFSLVNKGLYEYLLQNIAEIAEGKWVELYHTFLEQQGKKASKEKALEEIFSSIEHLLSGFKELQAKLA